MRSLVLFVEEGLAGGRKGARVFQKGICIPFPVLFLQIFFFLKALETDFKHAK